MSIEELAAQVDRRDRARARELIQEAVRRADELWLPGDAIAEALASELAGFAFCRGTTQHVAGRLRQLADDIARMPQKQLC